MASLEVNPARLAAAGEALTEASGDIDEILTNLIETSRSLQSSWDGAAQQAFANAERAFRDSMSDRAALVKDAGGALGSLATAYSDADRRGQKSLGPQQ